MKEKRSRELNVNANLAKGSASDTITVEDTRPPISAATSAQPRAFAA
jgi:hypothetical protein